MADEPTGFVWVEKGRLAGSGYPASKAQVEWIAKTGIGSILTLTMDPLPTLWTGGAGLVAAHLPMEDHEPPSPEALDRAVDFVAAQIAAGNPVLVHCLAGEGRTGCVLSAYLIRTRGVSAEEAMAALRKLKPGFVERRQEEAVRAYADHLTEKSLR